MLTGFFFDEPKRRIKPSLAAIPANKKVMLCAFSASNKKRMRFKNVYTSAKVKIRKVLRTI
ncbi:MAG: Uncharacterised protein [Bacteroidetes bacterium MED-G17]|nr:MAG: Uncharacterised protein [Bacteroidetes bacterium MED-G17]